MSIDNATPAEWNAAAQYDERFAFVSAEYNAGFRVHLTIDSGARGVAALGSLNRELDKPFGEVPLASRALAFALYQDGWLAEYRADDGDWTLAKSPLWGPHMRYRICAKPEELVLPSIDWSAVHADFRWLAQDECGDAYLTSARPRATGEEWLEGCKYAEACGFSSFKRGKGDWTKLLVERSA